MSLVSEQVPYKVIVRLKATGNAPILKQQVFKLSSQNNFSKVIQFIRKELALKESDSFFAYVNSAFVPTPDDFLGDLFELFGVDGTLLINYSLNPAWG